MFDVKKYIPEFLGVSSSIKSRTIEFTHRVALKDDKHKCNKFC